MGQALDLVNHFMQLQDPSLLAEDFRFSGPVDQTTGVDAFLQLNASFFPLVTGMRMLKQFEQGNDVCSIYEMDLKAPSGTSLTLHLADWVVVNEGKLVEDAFTMMRGNTRLSSGASERSHRSGEPASSGKGRVRPRRVQDTDGGDLPGIAVYAVEQAHLLAGLLPARVVERCLSQVAVPIKTPVS